MAFPIANNIHDVRKYVKKSIKGDPNYENVDGVIRLIMDTGFRFGCNLQEFVETHIHDNDWWMAAKTISIK